MSDGKMTYEDWLRGCVYHDGRHGYVTLPCDEVLKIADFIERLRESNADQRTQDVESVEADTPQTDEYKNFDREALILLIECQKERIGELLADKDTPQPDCPWK